MLTERTVLSEPWKLERLVDYSLQAHTHPVVSPQSIAHHCMAVPVLLWSKNGRHPNSCNHLLMFLILLSSQLLKVTAVVLQQLDYLLEVEVSVFLLHLLTTLYTIL